MDFCYRAGFIRDAAHWREHVVRLDWVYSAARGRGGEYNDLHANKSRALDLTPS